MSKEGKKRTIKRLDDLINFIVASFERVNFTLNYTNCDKNKNIMLEQNKRMEQAKKIKTDIKYNTDIDLMICDCEDYIHNQRPCKHIFSKVFNYIDSNGIVLPNSKNGIDFINNFVKHKNDAIGIKDLPLYK